MADEFDKPLEQAKADEYGEDAEIPLLPQPTETRASYRKTKNEAGRTEAYIEPALQWLWSAVWISLRWVGRLFVSSSFWTAAATVVIAVATIFYTIYAKRQWKEIHDSSTDTHKLAVAASEQATKIKDMSEAADKIRQAAERVVAQEQKIAANAHDALEASAQQSRATLNAAIAKFRDEQRPWVGLKDFRCDECKSEIDTNGIETLTIGNMVGVMENTGRTPAVRMITDAFITPREARQPIPYYGARVDLSNPNEIPTWPQKKRTSGQSVDVITRLSDHPEVVLPPGTRLLSLITNRAMRRSIKTSNESALIIYVVGKIVYYSPWGGKEHTTKFCIMSILDADFQFCPTGSTME